MVRRLFKGCLMGLFWLAVAIDVVAIYAYVLMRSEDPPRTAQTGEPTWDLSDAIRDLYAQRAWRTDEIEQQRLQFEYDYSKVYEIGVLSVFLHDPYLPIAGDRAVDDFWNYLYSEALQQAGEPKLRRGLLLEPGAAVMRVVIMPSFDDTVVIRAEKRGSEFIIASKRIRSHSILNYAMHLRGTAVDVSERTLSTAEGAELARLLADSAILRGTNSFDRNLKDGTAWLFEASFAGRYNAFQVHEFCHRREERALTSLARVCRFLLDHCGQRERPTHQGSPLLP